MTDQNGIPTSKEMIAVDYWVSLNWMQKSEIMEMVDFKEYKSINKKFNMIIDYIVSNLIEYKVNGNILIGAVK